MNFEIRAAADHEMDQLGEMGAYSYGGVFGDGADNVVSRSQRPEWTLCAFDGDTMATSFAAFPFTIRANGGTLGYAGITAVGTRPEYRRRGLLRKIMTQALSDYRDQGQAVAGLWASQAAIYQRYGFTMLGANRRYAVDTVDINFLQPIPADHNHSVRRHPGVVAMADMKSVYIDFIAPRFGYLHRGKAIWLETILDENPNDGPVWSAVVYAHDGQPCGYVVYTLRGAKVSNAARNQQIVIRDLAWNTPLAYQLLWDYLAKHDLVGEVVWPNAPVDDPLMDMLNEPRMLHMRDEEASWFRIIDVEQALVQRGYSGSAELVVDVQEDSLAPWNSGRWHLLLNDGDMSATRTSKHADVSINIRALSGLFCGSQRALDLFHWGQLDCRQDVARLLGRVFATDYAPHCPDHY